MDKSSIDSASLTPTEKVNFLMNNLYKRDSSLLQDNKQECRLCGSYIPDDHLYIREKNDEYIPLCKEDALFILYINMTKSCRPEEYNEFLKAIGREDLVIDSGQSDSNTNKNQSENEVPNLKDPNKIETIGVYLIIGVCMSIVVPLYITYKILWWLALPIMVFWDLGVTTNKALENAASD